MSEQRMCIVCQRRKLDATQLQTCTACVERTRQHLIEIVDDYALLPTEMTERAGTAKPMDITGVHSSDDQMPGGDALVLLAGGSGRWHYGETGVDSVAGTLGRWEDDWRVMLHAPAAREQFTVSGCSVFLLRGLSHMAQHHPAFDEFAEDIRTLHGAIKRALRDETPYDRAAIECDKCGSDLKHEYRDAQHCDHPGKPHCDHSHLDAKQWPCSGSNTCECDQGGRRDEWVCKNRSCGNTLQPGEYWSKVRVREHEQRQKREAS